MYFPCYRVCCALVQLIAAAALLKVKAAPESDLVHRLPGQPEVSFKQYAGYVTVDAKAGRAFFYYFVEAEQDASLKPLTLWLNGGPGCSSIGGGAFTELGPFYPNASGQGLLRNTESWNKESNMLFLEAPAGVGWSYSNTSSDYDYVTDKQTARDTLEFLLGWLQKFPEYEARDFYITGESYAGHYVPQLADLILKHNQASTDYVFRLRGVAIGNPLLNLGVDTAAMYQFFWSHGLISDETFESLSNHCNFEDYELGLADHNVSDACNEGLVQSSNEVGRLINNYDIILDVCLPSIFLQELRLKQQIAQMSYGVDICIDNERDLYFNRPEVQESLHANTTGLPYPWTMCTGPLNYAMKDASINVVPLLGGILQAGLRLWIFSGDQDSVVPLTGTRTLMGDLAKLLGMETTLPYTAWYQGGQVAGWTQVYGNLTYATVRGAAHMVPYAQPERALLLFKSFVTPSHLPTKAQ